MRNCRTSFLIGVIAAILTAGAVQTATSSDLRPLRVGVYQNPPKVFSNQAGRFIGIFPDLLNHIAAQEGWRLEFIPGSWTQGLARLENESIDIMVDVAFSKERALTYEFTNESVFLNWGIIYTRAGFEADSFLDLKGRTIAVMRGSIHTDGDQGIKAIIDQFDITPKLVEVDDYPAVFEWIDEGRADAGVVNRLFGALNENSANINRSPIVFNPSHLKFAFPKGAKLTPYLKERIDLRLSELKSASGSVYHEILEHYFAGLSGGFYDAQTENQMVRLELTPEESAWLRRHPRIRVGVDPAYPPFEWINEDGRHQGISSDYLSLLEDRLKINVDVITGLTWTQILEGIRDQTVDMIACISQTPERKAFLRFTRPYLSFPVVIITRTQTPFISGIRDLYGKKVSVERNYATKEALERNHPEVKLSLINTPLEGLQQVSTGLSGAYIGNLAVCTYLLQKHHITNLKVAAPAEGIVSTDFCIGVRPDWPDLVSILNKTLASIKPEEHNAITTKWMAVRYEHAVNWGRVFRIAAAIIAASMFLLGAFFYWNRKLSAEIAVRKKFEVQLNEAKQEAEKANRAKSVFLASMSHEIRTPMNAILGYSQLMRRDATLSEGQQKNIEIINRSGEHLLQLINDVLEMSKIEAGRIELQLEDFNLWELLEDLKMMFQVQAGAKGLQLTFSQSESVPRIIVSDKAKLKQILINLLGNAIKFTDKGEVSLKITAELVTEYSGDPSREEFKLWFEVKDTGIGISPEDHQKIFHSFEQSDSGRGREGTGLGLSISKQYILLMGGDIKVTSEAGKGSAFVFFFNAVRGRAVETAREETSLPVIGLESGQPGYRILVVDDKTTNRDLLAQLLDRAGFEVKEAVDGKQAVSLCNEWRPHLIMMDIRMPVMDGVAATRIIKTDAATKDIVIIAVSASALEEERIRVLQYGADGFIRKPFRENEIFEEIKKHLHVAYRHADRSVERERLPAALSAEVISALPLDLVIRMNAATEGGYHEELLELIETAALTDPQIAEALRQLAEAYDYEQLSLNFKPLLNNCNSK